MDVEKTMEFILEQLAHAAAHLGTVAARVEEIAAFQARTDRRLDRAIRLAVEGARRERQRRKELEERLSTAAAEADEKITQLAAAQLITEEKLQRLIDERRGPNGKG